MYGLKKELNLSKLAQGAIITHQVLKTCHFATIVAHVCDMHYSTIQETF